MSEDGKIHCDWCGKQIDVPFDCKSCHNSFCADHILPQQHNCIGRRPRSINRSTVYDAPRNRDPVITSEPKHKHWWHRRNK